MYSVIAVFCGAGCGALIRWLLSLRLNHIHPDLPLGTLSANLLGGYLIGIAIAFFENSSISPEWKLFVITGFLGGLTTFSTFSVELVTLMQANKLPTLLISILLHLGGTFSMTILGIYTYTSLINNKFS